MSHELFKPLRVGNLTLRNRIAMAPLTRHRSTLEGVPTDLNVEYSMLAAVSKVAAPSAHTTYC
jgi:2,4-dienoyl-CoA reductase-like NADH-dependent reductase (Old Yellow Enzyme family)